MMKYDKIGTIFNNLKLNYNTIIIINFLIRYLHIINIVFT